jgi:hypothetical protein
MRSKLFFAVCLVLLRALFVYAQEAPDLTVGGGDLWVSQGADGGYHLYIRKKPGINSVLLAETTRDPLFREPNYAYRTAEWNTINGNELRVIDGAVLPQRAGGWFLVDSTPEYVREIGADVFHIFIPFVVSFGYPETRHGEVYVGNGTYINVRTFTLPYADYSGAFRDNPFVFEFNQVPLEGPPEGNFMKDTEDAFERITGATDGNLQHSVGPKDIVEKINTVITDIAAGNPSGKNIDLVICLDTTESMRNDIAAIQKQLIAQTAELASLFKNVRIGMVLYRDYRDAYLTRIIPFTGDLKTFQRSLNAVRAAGGGDIPEAVNEALYDAATKFPWGTDESAIHTGVTAAGVTTAGVSDTIDEKIIILIGDAPPHPIPRGEITERMAIDAARERGIKINAIILPQ